MKVLFKIFRIIVLLAILVSLAFYAKTQKLKSRSWSEPLEIVIYPMNGDNSTIVEQYIKQLKHDAFKDIDHFFQTEAHHYSLIIQKPTVTSLGTIIRSRPSSAPLPNSHFSHIAWWSMKFATGLIKTHLTTNPISIA